MRKIVPLLLVLFCAASISAQPQTAATGTELLKKELHGKLGEWHKTGKFPGATLGVDLGDLEKLMTVD